MTSTPPTPAERAALRKWAERERDAQFGVTGAAAARTIRLLDQVESLEAAARDAVAAFRKYCPDRDSRYGQVWQATEDALRTGVVLTEGGYRVEGGPDAR